MPINRFCLECHKRGFTSIYPHTTGACISNHPEPSFTALENGTVVSFRGQIYTLEFLDAGAMGITYRAKRLTQTFVLKELVPVNDAGQHADNLRRFVREAEIQEILSTTCARRPLPIPFGYSHETERTIDREVMLMDFINGQPLNKVLATQGTLNRLTISQIIIELCDTLAMMHNFSDPRFVDPVTGKKGVVHRDLKPHNVMIVPLGSDFYVVLLDFGIARSAVKSAATQAKGAQGTIAGTPQYWAPEQLGFGSGDIDGRTDIYALGAMMYELITGTQLNVDIKPRLAEVTANIKDPDFQGIIRKCIQIKPENRYQTVEDLRVELVNLYEAIQPLPAHLQPTVPMPLPGPTGVPAPIPTPSGGGATPPPTPPPAKPADRWIEWDRSSITFTGTGKVEYRQDISGRVVEGRKSKFPGMTKIRSSVSGVRVHVFRIRDAGAGSPTPQTDTVADKNGDFEIESGDTTVPTSVSERALYVRVEDSRGNVIHEERITIGRPVKAYVKQQAGQAGQQAQQKAAAAYQNVLAHRPASFTGWCGLVGGLGLFLLLVGFIFSMPLARKLGIWVAVLALIVWLGEKAYRWYQGRPADFWTTASPNLARVFLLIGAACMLATIIQARVQVTDPGLIPAWIWPQTFLLALTSFYFYWRLRVEGFSKAARRTVIVCVFILWFSGDVAYFAGRFVSEDEAAAQTAKRKR